MILPPTNPLRILPACLVALRLVLAPGLLAAALLHVPSPWLALLLTVAFLSDVFDGISARRLGVATAGLRLADSHTDVVFYLCVLASVWILNPAVLWQVRWVFLALVVVQLASWILDRMKFGRPTALHSYSAKAWGISLFLAALAVFCRYREATFIWAALVVGFISNAEDIAIKLVLPVWTHDVGSIWHAYRIREAARKQAGSHGRCG